MKNYQKLETESLVKDSLEASYHEVLAEKKVDQKKAFVNIVFATAVFAVSSYIFIQHPQVIRSIQRLFSF